MSLGTRLQSKSTEYQKLQGDLAALVDKMTRLDTQLSENEMVKKVFMFFLPPHQRSPVLLQEFANLTPNNTIFKLVGHVLVPQDHTDARTNVETRLDFIRGEMYVR